MRPAPSYRQRRAFDQSPWPVVMAFAALVALAGPGVGVAHADDIAPTAAELFSQPAPAKQAAPAAAAACDPERSQRRAVARQQAAARLAQLAQAQGAGGQALRNGMGYAKVRDPLAQMRMIEAEAAAQHHP